MDLLNRIQCTASIGTGGIVSIGSASPGFRAPTFPTTLAGSGGTPGIYPYVLEGSGGSVWEVGYVEVDASGYLVQYGGIGRKVIDSSAGTISVGTTGLTFKGTIFGDNLWSAQRGDGTMPPRAYGTSMAAGVNAYIAAGIEAGIAVGRNASVTGNGGISVGDNALAMQHSVSIGSMAKNLGTMGVAIGKGTISKFRGEAVIGGGAIALTRHIPIKQADGATGQFYLDGYAALDLYGVDSSLGTRVAGFYRLHGSLSIIDSSNATNSAYAKLVSVDYVVWVAPPTGQDLVGTPTITDMFVGASAPSSTITINSSGYPVLTTASGTLTCRGMLNVDDLQSSRQTQTY